MDGSGNGVAVIALGRAGLIHSGSTVPAAWASGRLQQSFGHPSGPAWQKQAPNLPFENPRAFRQGLGHAGLDGYAHAGYGQQVQGLLNGAPVSGGRRPAVNERPTSVFEVSAFFTLLAGISATQKISE